MTYSWQREGGCGIWGERPEPSNSGGNHAVEGEKGGSGESNARKTVQSKQERIRTGFTWHTALVTTPWRGIQTPKMGERCKMPWPSKLGRGFWQNHCFFTDLGTIKTIVVGEFVGEASY